MVKTKVKRKGVSRLKSMIVVLITGLFLTPVILGAGLYRWVDDQGIVHFGDRIPVKYSKLKRDQLSSQGVVIQTFAAEKTKQELIAEAQERKRLAQLKKEAQIIAERNRVILSSYTDASDIDVVRDLKVDQLKKQIDLLILNISNLDNQSKDIASRIRTVEKNKNDDEEEKARVLSRMRVQLNDTNNNLSELNAEHSKLNKEISELFETYATEKKDFIRLMEEKEKQRQAENHPLY